MKAKRHLLLATAVLVGWCFMIFGTFIYKIEHPSALNRENHLHFDRADIPRD